MTKGSLGLIAVGSMLAWPLLATGAAATAKAARTDCIQLAHAGGQERPIGSVRMCPGKKAKREFQSSLENKWGFQFDPATFSRLREIAVHEKHEPTPAGILPPGTFSVTWRDEGKVADDDYTLEPDKSCLLLDQLANAVHGKDYSEFVHVVKDLKARVHCAAPDMSQ